MPTSSTFCISRERPPFQSSPGEQSPPSSHTGGASLSFCFLGLLLGLLGLHRGMGTRSPVWELIPTETAKFQSGMCCGPGGWGLSPALVLMSNQFHGNWCCLIKIKNSFFFFSFLFLKKHLRLNQTESCPKERGCVSLVQE